MFYNIRTHKFSHNDDNERTNLQIIFYFYYIFSFTLRSSEFCRDGYDLVHLNLNFFTNTFVAVS